MGKVAVVPTVGEIEFPDDMPDTAVMEILHDKYQGTPGMYIKTKYSALSDSTLDNVASGMGKVYSGGVNQAKKAYGNITGDQALVDSVNSEVDNEKGTDKELSSSKAGIAGQVLAAATAVPLASAALPAGAGGFATAMTAGGIGGLAEATGSKDSTLKNTAVGVASGAAGDVIGKGVGAVAGRLIQPVRSALSDAKAGWVKTLNDSGIETDAAQSLGGTSSEANAFKKIAEDSPTSAATMQAVAQQQKNQATAAVLGHLGDKTGAYEATPRVMSAIRDDLGTRFDNLAARNPVKINKDYLDGLTNISVDANASLTADESKVVHSQIDNILALESGGALNGKASQNINTKLRTLAEQYKVTKPALADTLNDIRDVHMAGMTNSAVTVADATEMGAVRSQYRMLQQAEKAIQPDNSISLPKLYDSMDTVKNKTQMIYGKGDQTLVKLAQAGKNILTGTGPNSGTASRLAGMSMLGMGLQAAEDVGNLKFGSAIKLGLFGAAGPQVAKAVASNPKIAGFFVSWAKSNAFKQFRQAADTTSRVSGDLAGSVEGNQDENID